MSTIEPNGGTSRTFATSMVFIGTAIWAINPFPFFGLGPLQTFLPDQYYMRTIEQLRQAGMLHATSEVFIIMEIQAAVLLTIAILASVRGSAKLAVSYVAAIIILSIVPWVRFFSELNQVR